MLFCNYLVVVFHSWKAFQVMKCYFSFSSVTNSLFFSHQVSLSHMVAVIKISNLDLKPICCGFEPFLGVKEHQFGVQIQICRLQQVIALTICIKYTFNGPHIRGRFRGTALDNKILHFTQMCVILFFNNSCFSILPLQKNLVCLAPM